MHRHEPWGLGEKRERGGLATRGNGHLVTAEALVAEAIVSQIRQLFPQPFIAVEL